MSLIKFAMWLGTKQMLYFNRNVFFLFFFHNKEIEKVKLALEQATKAQMGRRGIALLFLEPRR